MFSTNLYETTAGASVGQRPGSVSTADKGHNLQSSAETEASTADDDVTRSCTKTITYTTHGEFGFLFNLEVVAQRWQGPISAAIFAPGN